MRSERKTGGPRTGRFGAYDLTGMRFGRLTVLNRVWDAHIGLHVWQCQCDCGNITTAKASALRSHHKLSCGCLHKETAAKNCKARKAHGLNGSRIYSIWQSMKTRCYNKNDENYKHWGAKGIKICDEWLNSIQIFYEWAIHNGYKDNLTIDRIDNSKGYYPDNCRWVTLADQAKNRTNNLLITYNGQTKILEDWAKEIGITHTGLKYRISKYGVEKALSMPFKKKKTPTKRCVA